MTDANPEHHDNSDRGSDAPRKGVSRRGFIQKLSALGLAGFGASAILAGCGSDDSSSGDAGASGAGSSTASADLKCDDVSGLTPDERDRRAAQIDALNYVEQTEKPNQNCANCQFYQQPGEGEDCGGCTLFPGPVNPNGWCTTWVQAGG